MNNEQLAKEVLDVAKELAAPIDIVATGVSRNIWIGLRTDGKPGTGTQADPFDGSTPEKFDTLFREKIPSFTRINILPGVYLTHGSGEGNGPLCFKSGWKIHGSGMALTVIRLIPSSYRVREKTVWLSPPLHYGSAADVEVCDLTIDCDFRETAMEGTCVSGLYNVGARTNYRRVEVIRFGSNLGESYPLLIAPGRDFSSGRYVVEDCVIRQPIYFKPVDSCVSAICIMGQLAAPELLPAGDDGAGHTYAYQDVNFYGQDAIVRGNHIDLHLPNGKIALGSGIVSPGAMPAVIKDNHVAGCEYGIGWQDSEPVIDCIIDGNTLQNNRRPIAQFRGWKPNANNSGYNTRRLIIRGNTIYMAKSEHWGGDWPIGIHLYGDNPHYSYPPPMDPEFYTFQNVDIADNFVGFVSGRFGLHYVAHCNQPGMTPLPYVKPPADPLGWDAPVPNRSMAMVLSRIRNLQVRHNTIGSEFVPNPAIRLRGCKSIYNHGNRSEKGVYAVVGEYKASDLNGAGKFDEIPLDTDLIRQTSRQ